MSRLRAVCLVLCFGWCLVGLAAWPPTANVAVGVEIADFQEQLEKGLRLTTPEQKKFVAQLVGLVQKEQLPARIVNAAFVWARKRRPDYPYPYFERAVRILAAREGIKI